MATPYFASGLTGLLRGFKSSSSGMQLDRNKGKAEDINVGPQFSLHQVLHRLTG